MSCPYKLWSKFKFARKLTDAFKIIAEIKAVEYGVKPGWLNDICNLDFKSINFLMETLRDQKFISQELISIKLDEDILLANIETLTCQINRSINKLGKKQIHNNGDVGNIAYDSGPIFVYFDNIGQCTTNLPYNVKENLTCVMISLLGSLKSLKGKELEFNSSSFTPTLFGIILGYPFVYVINQERETSTSNLMDLYVTEIQIETPLKTCSQHKMLSHQTVCYSFSVPLSIYSHCKRRLDEWRKIFVQIVDRNSVVRYDCNTQIRNNVQVIL